MSKLYIFSAIFAAISLSALTTAHAERQKEVCTYRNKDGAIKQADSLRRVPRESRDSARCNKVDTANNLNLAKPEDINLKGNVREERISSPIGTMNLRWPRSVEALFGRSPLRAMTDAARTVSRVIKSGSFPQHVENIDLEWQIVFMDQNMPDTQIPTYLQRNCHPGWMTPPANIYIVAQRIAGGCSGGTVKAAVADAQLTETLVHELGHAVEHYMLKYNTDHDRMRSEGFATWFEIYASNFSSVMNKREILERTKVLAKLSIQNSPDKFVFGGTAEDYSRAAMYFLAIQENLGLPALIDVYKTMADSGTDFFPTVQQRLMWDRQKLDSEVRRLVGE